VSIKLYSQGVTSAETQADADKKRGLIARGELTLTDHYGDDMKDIYGFEYAPFSISFPVQATPAPEG
jgi:hypothetical protein